MYPDCIWPILSSQLSDLLSFYFYSFGTFVGGVLSSAANQLAAILRFVCAEPEATYRTALAIGLVFRRECLEGGEVFFYPFRRTD